MTYDRSMDCPHPAPDKELWQESDCYWFYDAASGVGGFNRLGQTPNRNLGQLQLFLFKLGGQRFSLQNENVAAGDCARHARGQKVGSATAESLDDMKVRWTWDEPDCGGDLEFYDPFYAPRDWHVAKDNSAISTSMNDGGHLECSGRVRGRVHIGGAFVDIDGFCHRDRSWGARDHSVVRQHRMFSGTVGPALSWAMAQMQFKGGRTVNFGFVVKDGVEHEVEDLQIRTQVAHDTLSVFGARAHVLLDNGDKLLIPANSVQGFVTNMFGMTSTDHIATVEYGGQVGFCDIEASFNPTSGTTPPAEGEVFSACNTLGLSKAIEVF